MYENRRTSERLTPIMNFAVEDSQTGMTIGHVADMSDGGMMLICPEPLAVGQTYDLRVRLDSDLARDKELRIKAETRWCKPDVNPELYATGLMATDVDQATRRTMAKTLDELCFRNLGSPYHQ